MVPWTCFEMWRPCFPHGVHHYRIVLRGKSYDAEKNGKLIGQFAELEPAQRCIEASAQRAEAWRARRMARVMAKTRAALAEEIRRDVPFERLFAAIFFCAAAAARAGGRRGVFGAERFRPGANAR